MKAWQGSYGVSKYTGIVSPAYFVFDFNYDMNPDYFHYAIRSRVYVSFFGQASDGIRVGQWDLSIQRMKEIPFYLPPRSEQDQIVRFLDWKVSNINKLINIKKKEIKDIDALKRSLISHAITHGLSADTPMKYSGVKWLGDIPAHWQIMKLRQILHSISVKNHPELPLLSVVREQGVILRDVEDTESNHNFIPDDLSGYKVVKKGQFAMNKMKAWQGSYGISDYTGIVSPAYFIFDVAFDNLEYFHYAIRSKVYVNFFAQASDGIRVGQWDLQMDKMKEIPFIIPPADEQNVIVEHIKNTLPTYNNAIEKLTAEVEVLEEYKTNIILFSISNYFLRYANMYKSIHGENSLDKNNWYEFVEYGTTNEVTIFLQRNGFSREAANYIKDHAEEYIVYADGETSEIKLKKNLLECSNNTVRTDAESIIYNIPQLFLNEEM